MGVSFADCVRGSSGDPDCNPIHGVVGGVVPSEGKLRSATVERRTEVA